MFNWTHQEHKTDVKELLLKDISYLIVAFCRFIPDDVTFEDEPKDRATDVDYSSYKPKLFTSTATTTAKVCHAESYVKSELLHSIYNNACFGSAACH